MNSILNSPVLAPVLRFTFNIHQRGRGHRLSKPSSSPKIAKADEENLKWIAEAGFNYARMTYSIDMALDPNQKVSAAFTATARGTGDLANVTGIFNTAITKNP
jgi:hypothetical protein